MRLLRPVLIGFLVVCSAGVALANAGSGSPQISSDESPLLPRLPALLGTAGGSVSSSNGYASLFTNPASFSNPVGSVTLLSASSWLDTNPIHFVPGFAGAIGGSGLSLASLFSSVASDISAGGFGYGAGIGVGIVGRGLAFAVSGVTQGMFSGELPGASGSTGSLTGALEAEITLLGGIAIPFKLFGLDVSVGADARPLARIHAVMNAAQSVSALSQLESGSLSLTVFDGVPTLNGYGLGIDAGVTVGSGPFKFGASLRDIAGTQLNYSLHNFQTVVSYIGQGGLPPNSVGISGDLLSHSYTVPMSLDLGVSLHPSFGSAARVFDPTFSLELPDAIAVFSGSRDVLPSLRASLDLRMFSILHLYAGAAVNYVSAGIGLKALFFDFSVAAGLRTVAAADTAPESGLSAEFAIRF